MGNLGMKSFTLRTQTSVISNDGDNIIWSTMPQNVMYLNWKVRPDQYVQINTSGEVADAVLAPGSFQFDEDIMITIGWADGFGIRRLSDNGKLELLYSDAGPVGYSGGHNLAIDKVNHKAYVGAYPVNGTEVYNYSNWMNGGTGSTILDGVLTVASNDMPCDKAGSAYFQGFGIAGDYLYMGDYVARSTVARWHIPTETDTSLPVVNVGAAGYRGNVFYEEEIDRMWILNQQNSGPWVVLSASTSGDTALAYRINVANSLGGADISSFMAVTEEDNSNHVWISSGYGRVGKFDISACITGAGANPTLLEYNSGIYNYDGQLPPIGLAGTHTFRPHPKFGSKLIIGYADRTFNTTSPFWYDKESKRSLAKWYNYGIDPDIGVTYGIPTSTNERFNSVYNGQFVYGSPSATTTEYMIYGGYSGSHGHRFRTFNADNGAFEFEEEGSLVFGVFTLNDNGDVGSIIIENLYINESPGNGTSFEVFVTNNTGATWEKYDVDGSYHNFYGRGDTVLVKFVLKTSVPYRSPNINSEKYPTVTIKGFDTLDSDSRYKIANNKILGNINSGGGLPT